MFHKLSAEQQEAYNKTTLKTMIFEPKLSTLEDLFIKVVIKSEGKGFAPWDEEQKHEKRKYNVKMYLKGEKKPFINCPFWTNDTMKDNVCFSALHCIVGDVMCYLQAPRLEDFIIEYGYNESAKSMRLGKKAFAGCEETYDNFVDAGFSESKLYEICNYISDVYNGDAEQPKEELIRI